MIKSRTSQGRTFRRCLGAAMVLVLIGSTAVAAAHSHADGQQHRQTCATCTVHYQPHDTAPPTALPEPPLVELVTLSTHVWQAVRADDFFPSSLSRAPPA
ncbi:MAG: hypothetical protein PVF05_12860 [Gemmatimonadales bacterium]